MTPWAKPDFWGNEQQYVAEALTSSWISGGSFVDRFERDIANFCGVPHALSSSNGTTSLHMAYLALGIGPGAEVVVPGFAFLAAANVAIHVGATPVFADVDEQSWCVTAASIEPCISARTKAIVPVHTYGNVCEMDEIAALGRSHGIPVIEDAAQAFGSRLRGRLAGSLSTVGSFSFQATKTITTGEGGMVITREKELYECLWLYRNHGMKQRRYWHEVAGHNFRLTNIQAALGCAQFEFLDTIVQERKRLHDCYRNHLGNLSGLSLQYFAADVDPVLWAIAVKLDPKAFPQGRDAVIAQLQDQGIESRPAFYSPSMMTHLYSCPSLTVTDDLSRQIVSLPTYPSLSNAEVERICNTLLSLRR